MDNYNRDSDPHEHGEHYKEYAQIAIDHYNNIEVCMPFVYLKLCFLFLTCLSTI